MAIPFPAGRLTDAAQVAICDDDAVIWPQGPGPKEFPATFLPIMTFYRAASEAGLLAVRDGLLAQPAP